MKKDEELKQIVEQEFFSTEAHADYMIDPRGFMLLKLMKLWHMVLQLQNQLAALSNAEHIESLERHAIYDDLGNTEGMAYASKAEMHNKINEIIERLNSIQRKEE